MSNLAQPGFLFTTLVFILVIGVIIFVHEGGHYLAGRMFRIKAETFSIGFGREIFGWNDKFGTRWRIGILPVGGYVKFSGDLNAASEPDPDAVQLPPEEYAKTFQSKPLWQRAIVIAAGPVTNFVFAVAIFAVFFMSYGHSYTPAVVAQVQASSPAAAAGLMTGDRILALDGSSIDRFEDLVQKVAANTGTPIVAKISHSGIERLIVVTPRMIAQTDRFGNRYTRGLLGISSGGRVVEARAPIAALYFAVKEVANITVSMAEGLGQIITGRRPLDELGGPLKIAQFSGEQAVLGLPSLIAFMALISINLGFINLLPVPVLDGGHLFLYAVEAIRRKPLEARVQQWAFMSGFVALMTLMLFVTVNDLTSIGLWKSLAGLFG